MNKAKTMFYSSMVYFIGRGLSGIVTMLMLPIYTNRIATEEYGYYETVSSIVVFLIPVVCLEVWTGMLKYALNRRAGVEEYTEKEIYSASFFLLFFGCAIFALGCVVLYLIRPYPYFWWILASGLTLALACNEGYVARSDQKNAAYAVSGVLGTLANACTGIACVYVFGMQAEAMFIAYTAGNVAQIIWLELCNKMFLRRRFHLFKINRTLLRALVIFCIPLGINSVVYYLMNNFNKLVITVMLGESQTGIFSVAGKFMAIATAVAAVIQYAWVELTFSLGADEEKDKIYNYAMNVVTGLSLFLVLGMLPAIHIVYPWLVSAEYSASFDLIPIYYYSLGFTIINGFLTNILRAENDTRTGLYGKIVACVFSIGSLVLLIPYIGLQAVGVAMSLGAIVEYVFLSLVLRKFRIRAYPVKIGVFTLCYVAASFAFYSGRWWVSGCLLAAVGIAFVLLYRGLIVQAVKKIFGKS